MVVHQSNQGLRGKPSAQISDDDEIVPHPHSTGDGTPLSCGDAGTPNRAIQCKARAFAHVVVCASTSGIASGHRVNLSTTVSRYR